MYTRDYNELFRYLMKQCCLLEEDIVFVENIADWWRENGIPEPDKERPFKQILKDGEGCKMLIRENITDEILEQRINALRVRSQLRNVALDRVDLLTSDKKKLAYLFLTEYATSLPDMGADDFLIDDWAFEEMERLGFFKEQT